MDLWLSQITTALFLDKHGVKDVLDKIIAKMEHVTNNKTNDNMEDNLSFRILQIVDNHIDELPRYATPLYKFINEKYEEEGFDKLASKDIRTCLKRLGFHQGTRDKNGTCYK